MMARTICSMTELFRSDHSPQEPQSVAPPKFVAQLP